MEFAEIMSRPTADVLCLVAETWVHHHSQPTGSNIVPWQKKIVCISISSKHEQFADLVSFDDIYFDGGVKQQCVCICWLYPVGDDLGMPG